MLYNKAIAAAASAPALKTYVEDVFSTYLYTGNGSTQAITNGIDLAGEGGLVWIKRRSGSRGHQLVDTVRGATKSLESNSTEAEATESNGLTAFSSTGFSLGADADYNTNLATYTSWTFRKAAKFFDVVTYTGDGTSSRNISHSLGSTPGFIIVKSTGGVSNWWCWHRSISTGDLSSNTLIVLNATSAQTNISNLLGTASSTTFQVGGNTTINAPGGTYVAYLFAHDAGGFGDSGNDNVISCGSYTGNGSTSGPTVTLGWEPQWLLIKRTNSTGDWHLIDNLRGFVVGGTDAELNPNLSSAESSGAFVSPLATGFQLNTTNTGYNASGGTYIYIAIRRGPMKTPTDATEVLSAGLYSVNNTDNRLVTTGILTDAVFVKQRNSIAQATVVGDRLRGQPYLVTSTTAAEVNPGNGFDQQLVGAVQYGSAFSSMNGFWVGNNSTARLNSGLETNQHIAWAFRRAPGFFDVVAYTSPGGTPDPQVVNHNLGVAPELIIVKNRSSGTNWVVWRSSLGTSNLALDGNFAAGILTERVVGATSTTFSVGTQGQAGGNAGDRYIAYLFATCPGVSKVGSYAGTGTTLNVDCGFTNGARFVLIKRTDSTGDWYVWDTARGIIAANDPYLLLNSTAVEVTNTDYIDPLSTGFQISSTAPAAINASGGSFIFLAIA